MTGFTIPTDAADGTGRRAGRVRRGQRRPAGRVPARAGRHDGAERAARRLDAWIVGRAALLADVQRRRRERRPPLQSEGQLPLGRDRVDAPGAGSLSRGRNRGSPEHRQRGQPRRRRQAAPVRRPPEPAYDTRYEGAGAALDPGLAAVASVDDATVTQATAVGVVLGHRRALQRAEPPAHRAPERTARTGGRVQDQHRPVARSVPDV